MQRLSLEAMQAAAAAHGGRCLSTLRPGMRTLLEWECAQGHRWFMPARNILRGRWCPTCARQRRSLSLADIQRTAEERGGRCLSPVYLGSKVKLEWECHLGHVWQSTPMSVKHQGTWCPSCAKLRVTKDRVKRLKWDFEGRE